MGSYRNDIILMVTNNHPNKSWEKVVCLSFYFV